MIPRCTRIPPRTPRPPRPCAARAVAGLSRPPRPRVAGAGALSSRPPRPCVAGAGALSSRPPRPRVAGEEDRPTPRHGARPRHATGTKRAFAAATTFALASLLAARAVAAPIPVNIRGRGWIDAEVLRCEEGRLWLALPGRSGEFAVAVTNVAWAAFPAPFDIAAAEQAARAGREDAVARLRQAYEAARSTMAVPGSHAPRLGLALAAQIADTDERDALLESLSSHAWDLHVRSLASLQFARLRLQQGRPAEAAAICNGIQAHATADRVIAEAWLLLARASEDLDDPETALDAYLHPIALYAREPDILHSALEGAERTARALGDVDAAAVYAEELRLLAEQRTADASPRETNPSLTVTEGDDTP